MRLMRRSTAALSSPRVMQGDFGRVTLKASARSMAAHGHAEYHCVFKLAGADTGFAVGQQRLVLDSDHAIVVNPWQTHAKLDSDGEPTLALALLLDAGWLAGLMGWDRSPKCGVFCQQRAALSPDIRGKVARLQQVMTSDGTGVDAQRLQALRELARAMVQQHGADPAAAPPPLPAPMDARIARAMKAMGAYADGESLGDIAAQVGLSRSRFFEQFRHCVGVTPQQYLRSQRMALATRRLSDRGVAVTHVAGELGFDAPSHFTRFFEQHIGFTPREFQRGLVGA